jgi:hypothetical protein
MGYWIGRIIIWIANIAGILLLLLAGLGVVLSEDDSPFFVIGMEILGAVALFLFSYSVDRHLID